MNSPRLMIAIAVVSAVGAVGIAVQQHRRASAAMADIAAEKTHNSELQTKIQSLEQELTKIKETADYYYQQGVDSQSAGDLTVAKGKFETVIDKFPSSSLVTFAKQRIGYIETEEQRRKEEKERAERESGEEIKYSDFYVKVHTGLPVGKRYNFLAYIDSDLLVNPPGDSYFHTGKTLYSAVAAFDDPAEYEALVRGRAFFNAQIVASMGTDGSVRIHKVHR